MCNGGCDDVTLNVGQNGAQGPQGIAGINGASILYWSPEATATTITTGYELLKEYTVDTTDDSLPLVNIGDAIKVDIHFRQSSLASIGNSNAVRVSLDGTAFFGHGQMNFLLPNIIRKLELLIVRQSNTKIFVELKEYTYGGITGGFSGGGYQRLDNDHMVYTNLLNVTDLDANGLSIQAYGLSPTTEGAIICDTMLVTSYKIVQ
jgi:hypothetical protein